jgi:hypothetical protein
LLAAAVLGLVLGASGVRASSVPTLVLTSGSTTITVEDGDSLDGSALVGVVVYNGPVGSNWNITVTTGITYPMEGTNFSPYIDVAGLAHSNGAGSITIKFESGDDFSLFMPSQGFLSAGGTAQNKIAFDSDAVALAAPLSFDKGSFSGDAIGYLPAGPTSYALDISATITHSAKGNTSFDAEIVPVPLPAAAGVGFSMLAGFGGLFGMRKKMRRGARIA